VILFELILVCKKNNNNLEQIVLAESLI